MAERLRIGFVDLCSIKDRSISSGVPFGTASALDASCGEVVELGPFAEPAHRPLSFRILNQIAWSFMRKTLYWPYSRPCLAEWGRLVTGAVEKSRCDVVFTAERSKWAVAMLETTKPIVVFTDSTMLAIQKMGGYFVDDLPSLQVARAVRTEQDLYRRAKAILVASRWARDSVVEDYGISPDKVTVAPFGANLLPDEVPGDDCLIRPTPVDECRLLWVGGNWVRKGGDLALQIRGELERLGVKAHLTLVGCDRASVAEHPQVRTIGSLQKSDPDQARQFWQLFRTSDLHILPSRGETFGIACAEAGAFGVPTIAPALGGIPEVVRDGVNGILVESGAGPGEYARRIAELLRDPHRYRRLSAASRKLYQTEHNWKVWGRTACQVLTRVARGLP